MSEFISVVKKNKILSLTFNRVEKKNAINNDMYKSMHEHLLDSAKDEDVHLILISGQKGVFTAGNDINDFLKNNKNAHVFDFLESFAKYPKPIVANIDGIAIGIGVTMLLHCDYVIASKKSVFQTPFTDLALVMENASSFLGPLFLGYQNAFSLFVLSEKFDAQKALSSGLISEIYEKENDQYDYAFEFCEKIAKKPINSVIKNKWLMKYFLNKNIETALANENKIFAEQLNSDEAKKIFMQFMQKNNS